MQIIDEMLIYKHHYSVEQINKILLNQGLKGVRIFNLDFDEAPTKDFSFLKKIEGLKKLSLCLIDEVDFEFLYHLNDLTELNIQTVFGKLDCSKLPQLNVLSLTWSSKNINNLETLSNLKYLAIEDFDEVDFSRIRGLVSLEALQIASGKIQSLNGIHDLKLLKLLLVGGCKKLQCINGVGLLEHLKYIEFNSCPKLEVLDELGKVKNLEVISLIDCKRINSLSFVTELNKLIQLDMLGSTRVGDKNLMVLEKVPKLYGAVGREYNREYPEKEISGGRRSFKNYLKSFVLKG